jgi:polar amino acid transport system substrate-binding protein
MHRIAACVIMLTTSAQAVAGSYRFVTLEFPPLEYADESGEIKGAAVEIVQTVMSGLKHKIVVEMLPWTRSLGLVRDGQADAIFTAYRNEEREQYLDYSNEVLVSQMVALYARKGTDIRFTGHLKQVSDRTIGIVSTISYGARFDLARDGSVVKTDRADTLEQNFRKLLAGRIDLVISNSFSAQTEMQRLGIKDQITQLSIPVEVLPSYVAFSRTRKLTGLRDSFDSRLRQLKASGVYGRILNKYGVRQ